MKRCGAPRYGRWQVANPSEEPSPVAQEGHKCKHGTQKQRRGVSLELLSCAQGPRRPGLALARRHCSRADACCWCSRGRRAASPPQSAPWHGRGLPSIINACMMRLGGPPARLRQLGCWSAGSGGRPPGGCCRVPGRLLLVLLVWRLMGLLLRLHWHAVIARMLVGRRRWLAKRLLLGDGCRRLRRRVGWGLRRRWIDAVLNINLQRTQI